MARIYLYETQNEGLINARGTIIRGNGKGVSKAVQVTIFIKGIGYVTIDRAEALKLNRQLEKILNKK